MALGSQGGLSTPNASEASQFVVKDFNFAADRKSASDLSSQDGITFTRSGAAYYYNSSGNWVAASDGEPVYEYSGSTSLGMRVEPATTNLIQGTAMDNSSYWGSAGSNWQGANVTGPDGVSGSGKRFEGEDTNLAQYHAGWASNILDNGNDLPYKNGHSASIWAKPGNASYLGMFFASLSKVGAAFYLNGDGSIVDYSNCNPSIEKHGDWYLCKCENLSNIAGTGIFGITPSQSSAAVWDDAYYGAWFNRSDYAGTTGEGFFTSYVANYIYLYGPQMEDSTTCTSYMPNTSNASSGVTRNPDVASIIDADFSNFYNQSQGTFLVEGRRRSASSSALPTLLEVNNNSTTDTMGFNASATKEQFAVVDENGYFTATIEAGDDIAKDTNFKIAGAYKSGAYGASLNGADVESNSLSAVPTPDRMFIGSSKTANRELDGYISRIRYWRRRTPDAYLKKIST